MVLTVSGLHGQHMQHMDTITVHVKLFPRVIWLHAKARAAYRVQTLRQFVVEAVVEHLKRTDPKETT